uniref:Uncharacterized protein n=1 Tax=Panagrolaimus davidi TaxID=227884 RepID=A0A914PP92_9BILA
MEDFFKLQIALILLSTVATFNEFCHTSECISERRQAWKLKSFQHKASYYEHIVQEATCSPCQLSGFTQCYNNGTCRVTGPQTFECDCPDNTTGKFCETILSCENENLCGPNAECYTGNANISCTLMTKSARVYDDPYFTTFDGTTFNYDGTCPYYLMKACNSSIDFSIQSVNTFVGYQSRTYIKNLIFNTQGYEIRIDENMLVYVNNSFVSTPFYLPLAANENDATIIVQKPSAVTITDTITNAVITFYVVLNSGQSYITVQVPLTPFFFGPDAMCGLFGNIDNHCDNDIRASNGTILALSNCAVSASQTVKAYQDTWVSNSTVDTCVEGELINNMTNCNITYAQQQCDLIRQATDGLGPFGACKAMGHDIVDKFYHDCAYSICQNKDKCDTLDIFAKLCLNYLPFANIDNWRSPSFCPYDCPPNSHYSLKTPTCQNSCADPNYSNSSLCHEAYNEACICDPGYFYDSNGQLEGYSYVCRPIEECGCVDSNKRYYPPNSHWINADCSESYKCYDGNLSSLSISCSVNGQCSNIRGNAVCECLPGYKGNGFNCTACLAPYSGQQCSEYTPARHCADLQLFHGISQSGVYSISIGADYTLGLTHDQLNWTQVYCDMENAGGGWTLMSHGNNTANKTYEEYIIGFGDATYEDIWLGLEDIHTITQSDTSLRVVIESCPQDNTPIIDCTYENFSITDSSKQYAIYINSICKSNLNDSTTPIPEGWITWDRTQLGPGFSAYDIYDPNNCSAEYYKTGWWFNGRNCGYANLNGLHFVCGEDNYDKDNYLTWRRIPIKDSHMFLRPKTFPNYDPKYNH